MKTFVLHVRSTLLVASLCFYLPLTAQAHTVSTSSTITAKQARRAFLAAQWLQRQRPQKKLPAIHTLWLSGMQWMIHAGVTDSRALVRFQQELRRVGYGNKVLTPSSQWMREWEAVQTAYEAIERRVSAASLAALQEVDAILQRLPATALVEDARHQLEHMLALCLLPPQNKAAIRPFYPQIRAWYRAHVAIHRGSIR